MSRSSHSGSLLRTLWLGCGLLAACATSTSIRFYALTGMQSSAPTVHAAASTPIYIDFGPVSVPERLARPQIVINVGPSRIEPKEHDRWSSPFDVELREALAAQVTANLGAIDVARMGRPRQQLVYRVTTELMRYDAALNDQVQATFSWVVTRSDDTKVVVCQTQANAPTSGNVESLVQGVRQVVQQVAKQMSATIQSGGAVCAR